MTAADALARLREHRYFTLDNQDIQQIIAGIPSDYDIFGPVKAEWALNYGKIKSAADLAMGFKSDEKPGSYRLLSGANGLEGIRPMNSPKWFTHRPQELLYRSRRDRNGDYEYEEPPAQIVKQAFIGLRACDVSAIYVLDRTFNRQFHDSAYDRRRRNTIIVGVDCFETGGNCFCSTFNTGPDLKGGYDIGLSYLGDDLLVDIATETGAKILAGAGLQPAGPHLLAAKNEKIALARRAMAKAFDLNKALKCLNENYDHPYWREPSARCLSCANCINVCPTCYCYRIVDKATVDLSECTRSRVWDACQHLEFAAVHGGNFRPKRMDRLRQWVNHKINWTIEQYGCAGCVGCGRCITWCPVAIDITEPVWRIGGGTIKLAD